MKPSLTATETDLGADAHTESGTKEAFRIRQGEVPSTESVSVAGAKEAFHANQEVVPSSQQSLATGGGLASDASARDAALLEKRFRRRLDLRLMPIALALYFFEFIDRSNIANAKLYGIDKGHNTPNQGVGPGVEPLSTRQWQLVVSMAWIGIALCEVPGCLAYRYFPASKWICFGVLGWSTACLAQVFAVNLGGLLVCRLLVGCFDGFFGLGMVFYLSRFYKRDEMAVRVFCFMGASSTIAGAFGGLLAYAIGHIHAIPSVPRWKWLFIVEGIPPVLLALFCLYWLPDHPMKNSRLSGEDQRMAVKRYLEESHDDTTELQWGQIKVGLRNWHMYVVSLAGAPAAAVASSISGFLPTTVKNLGYENPAIANLMTVPPHALGFVYMFLLCYHSDRVKQRGLHITLSLTLAAITYLLLATLPESYLKLKYVCICISVASVSAAFPLLHAWAANNLGDETGRALGLGVMGMCLQIGTVSGSWLYPATDAPQFRRGHFASVALCVASAIFVLGYSLSLKAANRSHDRDSRGSDGVSNGVGGGNGNGELTAQRGKFRFMP